MNSPLNIDESKRKAAILGGAILGGGGGGWMEDANKLSLLAMEAGFTEVTDIASLPDDALLATVSLVGAPSSGGGGVQPDDYVRAVELLIARSRLPIAGLISSEIGAVGAVNGWLQSARLGLPVVDAPCNGRAHPIGVMGSMGLHRDPDYVSMQTAVGGAPGQSRRVERFFEGSLESAARKVLECAMETGGMVAVARNPVPVGYVRKHGALGAIRMAIAVGESALLGASAGAERMVEGVLECFGGGIRIAGKVRRLRLQTANGLDVGAAQIAADGGDCELTFWNEYMTLEGGGKRVAAFPDLVMTFDRETAGPIISAELREGQEILLIAVPAKRLILGAGVRDPELLKRVDETLGALRTDFPSGENP